MASLTAAEQSRRIKERLRPRLWQCDYLGLSVLRRRVGEFAEIVKMENGRRLLDLGCGVKPYEQLFAWADSLVGFDSQGGPRVDTVGVTWSLPFFEGYFDAVISTQVLEHVERVEETVGEIYRVLRPDGLVFISVPFIFPEHGAPRDYRRFTEWELRRLLASFTVVRVEPVGAYGATMARLLTRVLESPRQGGRPWLAPLYCLLNASGLAVDHLMEQVVHHWPRQRLDWWYRQSYLAAPEGWTVTARKPR